MHDINFFTYGICKNSFGPWALDCGPNTPVTKNYAFGQTSLNNPIKGILTPSAIVN